MTWQNPFDQEFEGARSGEEHGRVFKVEKISDLPDSPPPIVIGGILYQAGKLLISAPSKARKTWLILELAYCVANGFQWWGKTVPSGQVLLLNFELQPWEVRARFERIQKSYGIGNFENIDVINLRGKSFKIGELPRLADQLETQKYLLTAIDPAYKLLSGLQESNTGDIIRFLAAIEEFATLLNAAAAISHHFTKGSAAAKDAIDRASGSGVWARDPDALVYLTPHTLDAHYTVNVEVRSFVQVDEFVIRWDHPRFYAAAQADPDDLRQPKTGRKAKNSAHDFAACLTIHEELTYSEIIIRTTKILSCSDATANRLLKEAIRIKLIYKSVASGNYALYPER
ncbi:MAG TPA: AAA family ATPase [Candidatus Angelobacter sp.]